MSANITPILQVKHVSKSIQSGASTLSILRDVNIEIKTGDTIAIVGPSGSGKTTLLTLMAGLDIPSSGEIYFNGHAFHQLNEDNKAAIRRQSVGFIFQSFQLLPTLTALENVMLPMEIDYMTPNVARHFAKEWLERVGLSQRLNHYPHQLSGGEQQRVAIARAFVNNRRIIFADELTGNLDEKTGEQIIELLFTLNREHNITLVIVTHDNALATRCQQHYYLHDGVLKLC
jgi:putative ABC transport system ATP-binding protein